MDLHLPCILRNILTLAVSGKVVLVDHFTVLLYLGDYSATSEEVDLEDPYTVFVSLGDYSCG